MTLKRLPLNVNEHLTPEKMNREQESDLAFLDTSKTDTWMSDLVFCYLSVNLDSKVKHVVL